MTEHDGRKLLRLEVHPDVLDDPRAVEPADRRRVFAAGVYLDVAAADIRFAHGAG